MDRQPILVPKGKTVIHDFGACRWFRAKPEFIAADTCEDVATVTDGELGGGYGDISPIRTGKTQLYVRSR